jgi:hypothetical protein
MYKTVKGVLKWIFLLLIVFGNMMCDKEKDTPELVLTGKQWKLSEWSVSPPYEVEGEYITDLYALMPECAKDDFTVFDNDGTLLKDDNQQKCSDNDPQIVEGTWEIGAGETKLRITIDGDETEYSIDEIRDDFLVLSLKETIDLPTGSTTYVQKFIYMPMN